MGCRAPVPINSDHRPRENGILLYFLSWTHSEIGFACDGEGLPFKKFLVVQVLCFNLFHREDKPNLKKLLTLFTSKIEQAIRFSVLKLRSINFPKMTFWIKTTK